MYLPKEVGMGETGSIMSMLGKNCQWVIYVVFSSIPTYTYVFIYIQYTSFLIRGGTMVN
jgi:hypothetical protein